eukprot:6421496-Prorocentrum_lima.AAC.1
MLYKRDKLHSYQVGQGLDDQQTGKNKPVKIESRTLIGSNIEAPMLPEKDWSKCNKEQVSKQLESFQGRS